MSNMQLAKVLAKKERRFTRWSELTEVEQKKYEKEAEFMLTLLKQDDRYG